jgi:hypothetical protein
VKTADYLFALTYERYAEMRTRKLRVILIRPDDLDAIAADDGSIVADGTAYADRLQTLRAFAGHHRRSEAADAIRLGRVTLGVLVPAA